MLCLSSGITMTGLLAFYVQVHGWKLALNHTLHAWENSVETFIDKLLQRAPKAWPLHHIELHSTMLQKTFSTDQPVSRLLSDDVIQNHQSLTTEDKPEHFEWLRPFENLRHIVEDAAENDTTRRILHIGCGNSMLTENLYDNGYRNIVNADNSDTVIDQMKRRNVGIRPEMKWVVRDATKMDFEDSSFELVIDKGMLDSLACKAGMENFIATGSFLKEVMRVLTDQGVYLCISFGEPDQWKKYLERPHLGWDIKIVELPPPGSPRYNYTCYAYLCRKHGAEATQKAVEWWSRIEAGLQQVRQAKQEISEGEDLEEDEEEEQEEEDQGEQVDKKEEEKQKGEKQENEDHREEDQEDEAKQEKPLKKIRKRR
eukprot:gnl/MRDRNA2_/MRDRNA2_35926_c0_seq1.p1 gnl/MRDRNA2_/MRDRNA2_35926_c0~~gnl/MRDRNA2_/MRDRNA2_35926_c0_seq1.p1  ORF type:complete len:370 (-),score=82.25 gnl/MRDRNA2_/MRDRNA2_35926_c0_seq1:100-1209(-)